VIVLNGDSLINIDASHLVNWHYKMDSNCTIVATKIENTSRYGTIYIDGENRLIGFKEKTNEPINGLVNAGIYIINQSIYDLMPPEPSFSIEIDFFPKILSEPIYGYICKEELIDIGTPDSYKHFIEHYQKYIR
tara:strand:+ start:5658 stop:6059 length:402 start_codon:yes stop_codon:yes gene_type:complete